MPEKFCNKNFQLPRAKFLHYLSKLSPTLLLQAKKHFDDLYYNEGTSIEDWRYDAIIHELQQHIEGFAPPVGAKLRDDEVKVQLPYWLGSLNTAVHPRDHRQVNAWFLDNDVGSFLIMDKVDGVSCLLVWDGQRVALYTRGDGEVGADISYIARYIRLPELSGVEPLTVRGELVFFHSDFARVHDRYSNPRNAVTGLIKAKTLRDGIQYINFVAYEMILPTDRQPALSESLELLDGMGFRVVQRTHQTELDQDGLLSLLEERMEDAPYPIDGIVVQANVPYTRYTSGNPEYAMAFKTNATENAIVRHVVWSVSKRGILKPVIHIEPVHLSGAKISKVTAHNALFVAENKIGPGALIEITRSGEVIPYVVDVLQQAEEADMPDIPYEWNETEVDVVALDPGSDMQAKILVHFANELGIDNLGESTAQRLHAIGIRTIPQLIHSTAEDFEQADRMGKRSAAKLWNNIHGVLSGGVQLSQLMSASYVFGGGLGGKKFATLLSQIPDLLTQNLSRKELVDLISGTEGFSTKTAEKVVEGLPKFQEFFANIGEFVKVELPRTEGVALRGQKFVLTGFRDRDLEFAITSRGGTVSSAVSGKTTAVIAKNPGENSGKLNKARTLGIPIYTRGQFEEMM